MRPAGLQTESAGSHPGGSRSGVRAEGLGAGCRETRTPGSEEGKTGRPVYLFHPGGTRAWANPLTAGTRPRTAAARVVSRTSRALRPAAAAELACPWRPGHFLPQGLDDVPEPPPRRALVLGQPVDRLAAHGGEGGILVPVRQPLPHGCLLLRVVPLGPPGVDGEVGA